MSGANNRVQLSIPKNNQPLGSLNLAPSSRPILIPNMHTVNTKPNVEPTKGYVPLSMTTPRPPTPKQLAPLDPIIGLCDLPVRTKMTDDEKKMSARKSQQKFWTKETMEKISILEKGIEEKISILEKEIETLQYKLILQSRRIDKLEEMFSDIIQQ